MGVLFSEGAAPSTPATGKGHLYLDTTGALKFIRDTGEIVALGRPGAAENFLANSGFWFAQRQAPGTLTTYSNTTGRSYGADRWGMTNENASVQYQRIDTSGAPESGLASRFYGRFKKITNAGKIIASQVLEGADAQALRGKICRFQARMKFSVAAAMTVRMAVIVHTGTVDQIAATFASAFGGTGTDPTWGTNLAAIVPTDPDNCSISGSGVTCTLTSAWQRFGAAFSIPTTAINVAVVIFSNAQLAANDELNVAEAGLYADQGVVDYTPQTLTEELARCQRYYWKTFYLDTAPAQGIGAGLSGFYYVATRAGAASEQSQLMTFPVHMFQPSGGFTATTYNPNAANAQVRDQTAGGDCSATTISAFPTGLQIGCTGNAGTIVGGLLEVHATVAGEL